MLDSTPRAAGLFSKSNVFIMEAYGTYVSSTMSSVQFCITGVIHSVAYFPPDYWGIL